MSERTTVSAGEQTNGNAGDLHLPPSATLAPLAGTTPLGTTTLATNHLEATNAKVNATSPTPAGSPPQNPSTTSGWADATERTAFQAGGEDRRVAEPAGRIGVVSRTTTETQIALVLNLDGRGQYTVSTGIRFFDHMLELFTRHGGFDLTLKCTGDLDVDQHHTVEDVGIALGEAFDKALGDKKGILRAGYFVMAMDETLAVAAVDLSGRVSYVVADQVNVPLVGDLQTELLPDFFDGFARGAKCNVHVKTMYGRSNHHKIEAIFKAFARALRGATSRDERMKDLLPSTKGLL